MTLIIKPKFGQLHNYGGTFFDDLEVTVQLSPDQHEIEQEKTYELNGWFYEKVQYPRAYVYKRYVYSDRRFRDTTEIWNLDELISKLVTAISFGELKSKQTDDFASFTVMRECPARGSLLREDSGVYMADWRLEPIYRLGGFDAVCAAVDVLVEIKNHIDSGKLN